MMYLSRIKRAIKKILLLLIFKINEKTYKTQKCGLKYLYFRNKKSNKLIVIFSALPGINQKAGYNYVLKFKNVQANRLYILDNFGFDGRGAYYLGKCKDFFIEKAVHNLINEIAIKNNIPTQNITTAGSSKGGFAALYFGIKYGYGEILSGAPQTLLGNYLIDAKAYETLRYIGGDNQEEGRKYLNSLLFNLVKETNINIKATIRIHVGRRDHHYENHILPFTKLLDNYKIPYDLEVIEYSNHDDVGVYFPPFALKYLNTL